ncbi:MAG: hypothetical protein RIC55_35130 [Pirellulaceae bacterium]
MQRLVIALTLVLAGISLTGKAQAQFGFWRRVVIDIERNKHWPQPFQTWDRQAQRAPWVVMVDKGWQLENTVGGFHFDRETQQLTAAGQHKVRWIVTETPLQRRTVFVQRGANNEETSIRIDAVQRAVAGYVAEGPLPEVVATNQAPPGSPADIIDRVYRGRDASQPAPVLPAASDSSGGGQ